MGRIAERKGHAPVRVEVIKCAHKERPRQGALWGAAR
jgi:hypothetical protein